MKRTLLAAVVVASLLAACGGGDDVAAVPPATTEVPASASQSPDGFIAYLQLLVASMADMLEPVDTVAVLPPADDTGEPQKID
jgi:ABC-type glycerol-3-phosphate transport system substrate-binding protein